MELRWGIIDRKLDVKWQQEGANSLFEASIKNQRSAAAGKAKANGCALKGQHYIAQGNALGVRYKGNPAP